ncbi:hypothetical protein SCATT_p04630 (plasmid) [Streptantibioticus cattleyicolor NRRL 8057 = DSM 46488]|uniref:Uncharacterized protein n=1 Tax=Streptantibioticus cattleyicolor (strain ATCC 35852 / DSM 46488 / JCM 4925 / NBRC 14057 / NRRL 8057) TaxID=1003195 RepID=G8XG18_STREN|nr:hypothetical protein SCATT_p04630 [Streptantibioticus cattleyicolor NRRL 8057 = DSM 46488]
MFAHVPLYVRLDGAERREGSGPGAAPVECPAGAVREG